MRRSPAGVVGSWRGRAGAGRISLAGRSRTRRPGRSCRTAPGDFLITTAGWLSEPVDKATWLGEASDRMTLDRFTLRLVASRRFGDAAVVLVESDQSGTH